MLTATYSFSVLAAEQRQVRARIDRLQRVVLTEPVGAGGKSNAAAQLLRLHADLQLRKIQTHVVPALSGTGADAAALLAEIAALADEAGRVLDALAARLSAACDAAPCEARATLCERYLSCLRERLLKEDQQLIPLAWRRLSPRQWFAIATACLSDMSSVGREKFMQKKETEDARPEGRRHGNRSLERPDTVRPRGTSPVMSSF